MYEDINNVNGDPNIAVFEANILNQVPVMETNNNIPVPIIAEPVPIADPVPVITTEISLYMSAPVKTIKNFFNMFESMVNEVKIIFRKNELYISVVDPAHVCMINQTLPIRSLLDYRLINTNELELSMDLDKLLKMFKGSDKKDIVTFSYTDQNDKNLKISVGSFNHDLTLLDNSLVPGPGKMPVLNFPAAFELDTKTFYNFLSRAASVTDYITIKTTSTGLNLNAEGDADKVNMDLDRFALPYLISNSTHKSKFAVDYLLNLFKTLKNVYTMVHFEIGDDQPLKIRECIDPSNILILLAPRIDSEV